jgi:hypothetical protein
MIQRSPQAAMIVVLKRDEAKWLKHAIGRLSHRTEDFRHAMDWARLRLECNFNKIALAQRTRQLQQSAGRGDGLEFSFCVPAVF